jgi:hypothetical protein
MRQLRVLAFMVLPTIGVSGALAAGTMTATAAGAVAAGPRAVAATWGTAQPILGPGGTGAQIEAMSCASAGNCSAGGEYYPASGIQPLVVTETNGTWGKALAVPGMAKLNTGGEAQIVAVSCTSPGNCSAGGWYSVSSTSDNQAFVVTETGGTWGTAEEIPGTAKLNAGNSDLPFTLSCASPGNCSVGGIYSASNGTLQTFVANQAGGTWGTAIEVPGTAGLNAGGTAELLSASCRSVGNCTAAGNYLDASGADQAFVVQEANGTWGRARELPGIAALSANGNAELNSVSCASAGNCGAIGTEWNGSTGFDQAFVVNQTSGTWGKPQVVPGVTALSGEAISFADPNDCFDGNCITISCPSAGNCSAGGSYQGGSVGDATNAFVVTETGGKWGDAAELPGMAALDVGGDAEFFAVSCGAAGDCSAGGYYASSKTDSASRQAFVATETGGTWGKAIEVPGTAKLNTAAYGGTYALSCASASACSAGGWYRTATSAGGFATAMPAGAADGSRRTPHLPAPSRQTAATFPARVPAPRALTATRPRLAATRHRWPPQVPH